MVLLRKMDRSTGLQENGSWFNSGERLRRGGFYNQIQNKNKSLKMKDFTPAFLTLFLKN